MAEAQIKALVGKMFAKKPEHSKLGVEVIMTVIKTKFKSVYEGKLSEDEVRKVVTSELNRLQPPAAAPANTASAAAAAPASKPTATREGDDDEEDEDDDDYESEEGEETSDDEDFDSSDEEASSAEEGSSVAESDDTSDTTSASAPSKKKHRKESPSEKSEENAPEKKKKVVNIESNDHLQAMIKFLGKIELLPRKPGSSEDLAEYRTKVLLPTFEKHKLDPSCVSKDDVKKYRMKRELELLQQEGVNVSLDRRERRGRATFGDPELIRAQLQGAQPAGPPKFEVENLFDE